MEAIANETQNDDDVRHMEQNQPETSFSVAKKATQFQQAQNIIESSVKKNPTNFNKRFQRIFVIVVESSW